MRLHAKEYFKKMSEKLPDDQMPSEITNRPENSLKTITHVVYLLQAIGLLMTVVPLIIAAIINHVKRPDVQDFWLETHFRWQLRTFWYGMLWIVIGVLISVPTFFVMGLGLVVFFIVSLIIFVWLIYRVVKGWLRLTEGKPMYVQSETVQYKPF